MNARVTPIHEALNIQLRESQERTDAAAKTLADAIRGIGDDVREEAIRHHESCLEAALEDMRRPRPLRPSPYFDYEMAWHWAELSANKHWQALQHIPGYQMPEYLSTLYDDATGA